MPFRKICRKDQIKNNENNETETNPKKDNKDILDQKLLSIKIHSNENIDDLIDKYEYEKNDIITNKSQYNEEDYNLKIKIIEQNLYKLRNSLFDNLTKIRLDIENIITSKKLQPDQFKSKIDLTDPSTFKDNNDPSYKTHVNGKMFFKNVTYVTEIPKTIKFPSNNGNKELPKNLKNIYKF